MNQFIPRVMIATAAMLAPIASAQAYVGPGLGVGTVMVILGFVGSLLLALFGIFWYPIKRVLKKRRAAKNIEPAATHEESVTADKQEAITP